MFFFNFNFDFGVEICYFFEVDVNALSFFFLMFLNKEVYKRELKFFLLRIL